MGTLRIRLPRTLNPNRTTIPLGLQDTPENRVLADRILRQLQLDLDTGQFNWENREKYRHLAKPQQIDTTTPPSVPNLWAQYTAAKKPFLEASTIALDYTAIQKRLTKAKINHFHQAKLHLFQAGYAPETVKRTLTQLQAMAKWARRQQLIPDLAPILDYLDTTEIRTTKGSQGKTKQAFTKAEQQAILMAIQSDRFLNKHTPKQYRHSHYYNYVYFLFHFGCRPSEAVALTWQDVDFQKGRLIIHSSFSTALRRPKATKTHTTREFPLTGFRLEWLKSLQQDHHTPTTLLFPSPTGRHLNHSHFLTHLWQPVVKSLVALGEVAAYLPPNNTRHTFITNAINAGMDSEDVAIICGNSDRTIRNHYKAQKRHIQVLDF